MELASSVSVRLVDCPSTVDQSLKEKAESRFANALLKSFQQMDQLRQAYRLFMDASEGGLINQTEEKIAVTWRQAYEKACAAGFQDLAQEQAYFDVQLH